MLYSGLLKRGFTNLIQDEVRMIDTNELAAKRIRQEQEHTPEQQVPQEDGFVVGLNAPEADLDSLLFADQEDGAPRSNVIKVSENAKAMLEEARKSADELLEQARQQAAWLEQEARMRSEQERMQILEQARQQGIQEGREQAAREAEAGQQELQAARLQLEAEYQQLVEELEPQFVDTITGIYEHIFHVELGSYREVLSYLISAAMRKIENSRSFLIHVSKDDYPFVSMQKKQIAAGAASPNSTVDVIEDLTLSKNECLIETESGIFDCSLGVQLSELRQKLRLLSYE